MSCSLSVKCFNDQQDFLVYWHTWYKRHLEQWRYSTTLITKKNVNCVYHYHITKNNVWKKYHTAKIHRGMCKTLCTKAVGNIVVKTQTVQFSESVFATRTPCEQRVQFWLDSPNMAWLTPATLKQGKHTTPCHILHNIGPNPNVTLYHWLFSNMCHFRFKCLKQWYSKYSDPITK